jgi:hypothetical protein
MDSCCCRSHYVVKKILEVDDPYDMEMHVCATPSCPHVFPFVDKRDWAKRSTEACPVCGQMRFNSAYGSIVPARRSGTDII